MKRYRIAGEYVNGSQSVSSTPCRASKYPESHLYKIETATRIFVLDCGTRFGFSGGECGGQRKIQIGDIVHFRVEKNSAYIPISVPDGHTGEQKLRIVAQELKPESHP